MPERQPGMPDSQNRGMPQRFAEAEFDRWLAGGTELHVPLPGAEPGWIAQRSTSADARHHLLLARVPLEEGACAVYGEFCPDEDIAIHLAGSEDLLLTFLVQSHIRGMDGAPAHDSLPFAPHSVLLRSANRRFGSIVQARAGSRSRFVQVRLSPQLFRLWMVRLRLPLGAATNRLLERRDGAVIWQGPWSRNVYAALTPWRTAALLQAALVPFLRAKAMELLTLFLVEFALPASQPLVQARQQGPAQVSRSEQALDLWRADLTRDWTLARTAAELGCSLSTLKNAFSGTGSGPAAGLRELRLQAARELLQDPTQAVADVAHRVGYACPSRFAALYRRRFGTPPGRRNPHADMGPVARPAA